jgi:hypothetical protein
MVPAGMAGTTILGMSSLESRLMQASADQFAAALRYQATIADISRSGVSACLDTFCHSDPAEAHYAPQSIAMGIASLRLLLIPLTMHAVDLECLNATGVSLAERG